MRFVRHRSLVAAAALALAGCAGSENAPAAGGAFGGTLIAVVAREPATLFPPLVQGTEGMAVVNAVYDRLAEIGQELDTYGDRGFRPRLASAWTWANDSLSIAFRLDSAARWHDGQPVRAADVRYTFRVYDSDSVGAEVKSLIGNIDSVSVRDSLTAVFWFKRRTPQQFYDATYHMFMLPSHLLDTIPLARVGDAFIGRQPVGTGRFRFATWERGQRIEIVADTTNARARAKLDRVMFSYVQDFGAATVKLFAGEADFYENVLPENLAQVARTPFLRVVVSPDLRYVFLGFNARDAKNPTAPHPLFGDPRVRRALSMAVDRRTLVRNVFDSLGLIGLGPAPRALIPDTAAFTQLPYDVARARALLDSAGWRDANSDGVRERNGVPLAFEILTPASSNSRRRFAVLLQEQLRAVGAAATPVELPGAAIGARMGKRDFDSVVDGWAPIPGLAGLRQTWASRGTGNDVRYASPAFDALLDSALTTFDREASRRYWGRAFQQIVNDAPAIWLYEQHTPVAVHQRFMVPPLRADGWYVDLPEWRVDPARQIDRDRVGLGVKR
jgi:peptide/nickel transport system substrate-binding protein